MATIYLTTVDNGRSVEARPGDEIVLLLPENPTTGYRWHIDRANGILELAADGYQMAELPEQGAEVLFGRGSIRALRFRASGPGTARLELKHWQAWEGEASVVERFTAIVSVSGTAG